MTFVLAIGWSTPYGSGVKQSTLYDYIYIYIDTFDHRSKVN